MYNQKMFDEIMKGIVYPQYLNQMEIESIKKVCNGEDDYWFSLLKTQIIMTLLPDILKRYLIKEFIPEIKEEIKKELKS